MEMKSIGIGAAVLGLGGIIGIFIRPFVAPAEITEDDCRERGFIRPEDCPPPCPPFDQIKDEGDCTRCGGTWRPTTAPDGGECIPPSGPGPGSGPGSPGGNGIVPTLEQQGIRSGAPTLQRNKEGLPPI